MTYIKDINFSDNDKESISQSGLAVITDDDLAASKNNYSDTVLSSTNIDTEWMKFTQSLSTGINYTGTTRTLEELLKANQVAYSILEREVIKKEVTEGIIGLKGKIDLSFISLSSSLFTFSLLNILFFFLKNISFINIYYSIFICIGSIGWLLTAIKSINSNKNGIKKAT